jgi:lysophospholipase L1-like esterase
VGRRVLGLAAGSGAYGVARLLKRQSVLADQRVRPYLTAAPPVREHYGDPADPPLTLAVLGDSSAQGVGVEDFDDTLGGWLAAHLAAGGRSVRVVCAAVDGSRAEHLDGQVTQVLPSRPDLAIFSTGANDVRNRTHPRRAARDLGAAVARLRAAGAVVVVGTTPYFGILTQIDEPLRTIGHALSRLLEREQVRAVVAAGGRPVLLGRLLSPLFGADRGLFARDGFHPSQRGYALIGEHTLPALLADPPTSTFRRYRRRCE